jgi:prepilin-type N-terminal cleavage/methylation domain-containing protein
MRLVRSRGFSFVELMVAVALTAIMLTISFSGLNKARTSGSSRGLATAVAAEFRLAREKAIAKGSPVAVVVAPGVTRSLFFLEGDTMPVVSRTVNYAGDYPHGAIAVATYPGPSFTDPMLIPGSKSEEWKARLNAWLPGAYSGHKVFMFTPNGTVVTNSLPAAEGTYRVVVGTGMELSGGALNAAGEPQTVAISQSGAVETFGHLLGCSGGVNTQGGGSVAVAPPPSPPTGYTRVAPSIIRSRVTPPAEEVDGKMVHVLDKGEYLTLEIFATSGDGRPLYAGWKDNPLTKGGDPDFKGAFSVPGGELERMEFYPEFETADLVIGEPSDLRQDVWRSVWTWTPPAVAEAGDIYDLTVDVTDAQKKETASIADMKPVVICPPGEIVFESNRTGNWHLYTMWADGSRVVKLTSGAHNYRWASATADGKLIAFEKNGNQVWVMNIDGTGQLKVANGRRPTISPTGDSIAYVLNGSDQVVVKRLAGSGGTSPQPSATTGLAGIPAGEGTRIAYSANGKWIYFTSPSKTTITAAQLLFVGDYDVNIGASVPSAYVGNIANPGLEEVGGIFSGRGGQVYYHADAGDPYIGRFHTAFGGGGGPLGAVEHRVSMGQSECFPAVSPNQDLLVYCEQVGGHYQIMRCDIATWAASGTGVRLTSSGDNLRPAWIRQGGGF